MTRLTAAALVLVFLGAARGPNRSIDLTRYFASPSVEARSRTRTLANVRAFIRGPEPHRANDLYPWLEHYDRLLTDIERHDIFVYLRAEENDRDALDAAADDDLSDVEDRLNVCIERVARELGSNRIATLTMRPPLPAYRYLLQNALQEATHAHQTSNSGTATVSSVLEAPETKYKALRKLNRSIRADQDAYASLLTTIVSENAQMAHARGFESAPEASYFDKSISVDSVNRTLDAIRKSRAYERLQAVEAGRSGPAFRPSPIPIERATALILAAERPLGRTFEGQYAALFSPQERRLGICTEPQCDSAGFSVGFSRVTSAAFFGNYDQSVEAARAVAHEAGHAVHRQFMNLHQPIAAYNRGPHFLFESFAIFSEFLFLDQLYRSAHGRAARAYYLDTLLKDAAFQVYGSAAETALEQAIYRGVADRSLRRAADFDALTTETMARYDPSARENPKTPQYWARDRLFFTDPLYDVNYLYAGLLALRYFADFEQNPSRFSKRYVALLENGFDDTPVALERRFLGIDLNDEQALVTGADQFIEVRSASLAKLYAWRSVRRATAGVQAGAISNATE